MDINCTQIVQLPSELHYFFDILQHIIFIAAAVKASSCFMFQGKDPNVRFET